MRPRLPIPGLLALLFLVAGALPARAQSSIPATWSTDPACGARALRVTFGANTLTIERNGRSIYRSGATVSVTDDAIAVRLASNGEAVGDPARNVIRFSRAPDAIRMVVDGPASRVRIPALYPCRATGIEAAAPAGTPSPTVTDAPAR